MIIFSYFFTELFLIPTKTMPKIFISTINFVEILDQKIMTRTISNTYFDIKCKKTALEVNFIMLKIMFSPFPFIFAILELKFFLSVAHWGHGAKHKFLKKMLHIGDNVAHWGVAHWVHPVYESSRIIL